MSSSYGWGAPKKSGYKAGNGTVYMPKFGKPVYKKTKYNKPVKGAIKQGTSMMQEMMKKAVSVNVKNVSSGVVQSWFTLKIRVPKKFNPYRQIAASNFYSFNNYGRLTAGVGTQNLYSVPVFNVADITSMLAQLTTDYSKIFLKKVRGEVMFTNQTNAGVHMDIYDIIAKKDGAGANTASPVAAWLHNYNNEGGAAGDNSIIGATPFSNELFTQYYKILKIHHVDLVAGQNHRHNVTYHPSRQLDGTYTQQLTQNDVANLTYTCMWVIHGFPDNDSVTKTQVSTGQVTVDWIEKMEYEWTFISDYTTTWKKTNNLLGAFTISEELMGEVTDSILSNLQA